MLKRRAMLMAGLGSITILGLGAEFARRTAPAKLAREPWRQATSSFGDPRLDVLAYALLAPNPHNMQPWLVRLESGTSFTLFCDQDRLLPETDPPSRQITIGFGCFLELCRQAAAAIGLRADITLFPDGVSESVLDSRPIAQVALITDSEVERDPLFATVLDRRTDRSVFDITRIPDRDALARIEAAGVDGVAVSSTNDPARVTELVTLARQAWAIEWSLDRTRRESIAVTRLGREAVNAAPYGITVDNRAVSAMTLAGISSLEDMDIPGTTTYRETEKFYDQAIAATPAFVWSVTPDNTRAAQILAGFAWVRTQLQANALGLSFHPLSQALQEFPEMGSQYQQVHTLLAGDQGGTVQMLCRIGFGGAALPAPREPLMAKIIAA